MEKLFTLTEVAYLVGVSTPTINNWYAWKRLNTGDAEVALLPDPQRFGAGRFGGRKWTAEDIELMKKFKATMKKGRNGKMGAITQRYIKKDA